MISHHDARTVDSDVGFAEGRDHPVTAPFRGSEIDEEHLILFVIDNLLEVGPAFRHVDRRHLAFEHRILDVIPVRTHLLEYEAQPLFIANVVADQVSCTHTKLIGRLFRLDNIMDVM